MVKVTVDTSPGKRIRFKLLRARYLVRTLNKWLKLDLIPDKIKLEKFKLV